MRNFLIIAPYGGLNDCFTEFFWGQRLAKRLSRTAVLSLEFNQSYKTSIPELLGIDAENHLVGSDVLSLDSAVGQGLAAHHIENLQTLIGANVRGYFCLDSMAHISDPGKSDSRVIASLKSRGGIIGSYLFFRTLTRLEKFAVALNKSYPLTAIQIRCGDLKTEEAGLARILEKREERAVFSDCDARELLEKHGKTNSFHSKLSISGARSSQDLDDLLEMAAHSQVFLLKLSHKHRVSGFGVLALTIWMAKSPLRHILNRKFLAPYWQLWSISPKLAAASFVLAVLQPIGATKQTI